SCRPEAASSLERQNHMSQPPTKERWPGFSECSPKQENGFLICCVTFVTGRLIASECNVYVPRILQLRQLNRNSTGSAITVSFTPRLSQVARLPQNRET